MARNLIAAVLLLAAIAGIAAQTADDGFAAPVMAETPAAQPGPMLINIEEPVPISVTEAPVAPAPLPSKPAFDANLLVKPEDITATMAFLDTVFKTDANVQQACLPQKIMTDYYALSVINCDRAQSMAEPGAPITACPEACQTGVTLAGAECVAAMNIAYIKSTAFAIGSNFTMSDFDPTGTLAACNVVVDEAAKATAFEVGQSAFFIQSLLTAGVSVPECGDFVALQTDTYAQNKNACASAPDCNASCQAAVTEAGEACLKALAVATATADPTQYTAQLQMFEKCNITPQEDVQPEAVPTPANATPAAPVSSAASSVSATAGFAIATAMLLL